jgi:hypothetical protein
MQFIDKRKGMFLFITIQSILYGIFLTLDLTGNNNMFSSLIKYIIILLCFCYVLFYGRSAGKGIFLDVSNSQQYRMILVMRFALLFTVVSDTFLLIMNKFYILGVLSFLIVQQLYSIKLSIAIVCKNSISFSNLTKLSLRRFLIQGIITSVFCVILLKSGIDIDLLLFVTLYYFISIVTNVIMSLKVVLVYPQVKSNIIFAIGMILFLLCDINVGLYNLSGFLALSNQTYSVIYSISSILMWFFYAPSQVLIAISAHYD